MKIKTALLLILFAFSSCGGKTQEKAKDSQNKEQKKIKISNIKYGSYYNQRYEYQIDYPDFLIPQGESTSGDGQEFISEDEKYQMLVYHTFKMANSGNSLSLEDAYNQEAENDNVFEREIFQNHYVIKTKINEDQTILNYSVFYDDAYYVILFEYPSSDESLFDDISKTVLESLSLNNNNNPVQTFLINFINDCWCDKNFDSLLANGDNILNKYLDPNMDVRRYDAPGAIAFLYERKDNFGFNEYSDFETNGECYGYYSLSEINQNIHISEIDFNQNENATFYYQKADKAPDVVVDTETFEIKPVDTAYPNADFWVLYLPNSYGNPRAFYFIESPAGFKLVFVDDSIFSA